MSRSHVFRVTPAALVLLASAGSLRADDAAPRPNILFAIADDWGAEAGALGDPAARTPNFDRIAREGVLLENAFVASPSCTPSRNAILTGQWHWRLGPGANLWSTLSPEHPTYPLLLEAAGYFVGHTGKCWGPGDLKAGGYVEKNPGGRRHASFEKFLAARPADQPFAFWLGSGDPHRPYAAGSGKAAGIDPAKVRVPACLPDRPEVREDLADYLFEVERFDALVGRALLELEKTGRLDSTLVVMTGDHGMPFPRGKSNLYDLGTRVPLAARWEKIPPGRRVTDFVSLADLAPTFLEVAGVEIPAVFTARSLLPILSSEKSGRIDESRNHVIFGKERHVPSQAIGDAGGYPSRGIRTDDWLYIRNFTPERWPNGVPDARDALVGNAFADCDDGPTKSFLIARQGSDPVVRRAYDLAFAKRPSEELYDLRVDPDQLVNVAAREEHTERKEKLAAQLEAQLRATADPRIVGGAESFDTYPYRNRGRRPRTSRTDPVRGEKPSTAPGPRAKAAGSG